MMILLGVDYWWVGLEKEDFAFLDMLPFQGYMNSLALVFTGTTLNAIFCPTPKSWK
jgi:hypothetical protein